MKYPESNLFQNGPIFGIAGADHLEEVVRAEDPAGFDAAENSFPLPYEIFANGWQIRQMQALQNNGQYSGKETK